MSDNLEQISTTKLSKKSIIMLIACAGLAAFWVIFLWNFWSKDVYALGLNTFVFLALFAGLFIWTLHKEQKYSAGDLAWIIPLMLIILSNLIYDNPFIKTVNILVFPATLAVFYNYAWLKDKENKNWDWQFFFKLAMRVLSFLAAIPASALAYLELIIPASKVKSRIISRIIFGLILFFIVAFVIFIPLLSSADAVFAGKIGVIVNWVKEIFSSSLINRIIVFIVFSILMSAMILAWAKDFSYEQKEEWKKMADPIVAGILLGGVLLLYLLFLWVQLERLWVGALPFDFKTTEDLVKSGFWQLFYLSIINISIYFFTYKKTAVIVQKILLAFTLASLLLLASAAYRMGLYVTAYGFSYEKFFASYTVVYCAILFGWLVTRLFVEKKSNMVKFLAMLFIWLYGAVAVMPMEQFIFRANLKLAQRQESRIKMYELTMLSPDVIGLVKKYQAQSRLKDDYPASDNSEAQAAKFSWNAWIIKQEQRLAEKKWFELNLNNIIYLNK